MAIVLDDTVDSAPIIQTEIPAAFAPSLGGLKPVTRSAGGEGPGAGAQVGRAAPPVRILEERSLGAWTGADPAWVDGGGIGLLAVLAFMASTTVLRAGR